MSKFIAQVYIFDAKLPPYYQRCNHVVVHHCDNVKEVLQKVIDNLADDLEVSSISIDKFIEK